MLRRMCLLATVVLMLVAGIVASAQEPTQPTRRSRTLGDRLNAFRRTLVGDSSQPARPEPDANFSPQQAGRAGSVMANPPQANPRFGNQPAGRQPVSSSRRRRPAANSAGVAGPSNTAASPRRAVSLQERLAAIRDPGTDAAASVPIVIPSQQDVMGQQGIVSGPGANGQPTLARQSSSSGGPAVVHPAQAAPEFLEASETSSRRTVREPIRTAMAPQEAETGAEVEEPASDLTTVETPAMEPVAEEQAAERPAFDEAQLAAPGPALPEAPQQPSAQPSVAAEPAAEAIDRPNVLISRRSPVLLVDVAGPETVVVGKPSSYTITVQNSGDVAAQDLVVTVMVPAWADLIEIRPTAGNAANPLSAQRDKESDHYEPLQWRLNRLEARTRERMTLRLVPRKSRRFDLAVQWTFSPVGSQAVVEVQEPKLEMSISGPKEVFYGEKKIYKLTLANPGTGDAENVTLHVQVGAGHDQSATDKLALLRAGESKVIELELEARQAGTLSIQARATGDGGLESAVLEEITVRRAALAVAVDAPPAKYAGSEANFRVHVSNPGNAAAESIRVSAILPTGAQYVSSTRAGHFDQEHNQVTWFVASLPPGGEQTLDLRCVLNEPNENRLRVDAQAAGELVAVGGGATMVEALADLKLEVRDPPGAVPVGEEVIYLVTIRNRGTKQAEQVEAFAYFSPGIEPIGVEGIEARVVSGEGLVEFAPIASLPVGGEMELRVRARADQPGNHIFRAEVVCKPLEIKLAADEITRFYVSQGIPAATEAAPVEPPASPAEPTPATEPQPAPAAAEPQPTPATPVQ